MRFLPRGDRFEESKYRWRRQEKRGEEATDKSQAAISVIFEKKQDAQKERGRERGFLHADVLQGDADVDVDVDEEIGELHSRVRKLKGVALAIEIEGKFENELPTQLESTTMKAYAMKKLN